jgi:hypothetical protein
MWEVSGKIKIQIRDKIRVCLKRTKSHEIQILEFVLGKIEGGDSTRVVVCICFGYPPKKNRLGWSSPWKLAMVGLSSMASHGELTGEGKGRREERSRGGRGWLLRRRGTMAGAARRGHGPVPFVHFLWPCCCWELLCEEKGRVNSLLAMKTTCGYLLVIKKFNFPIGHWVEILFLIGHPSFKVREQKSLMPLITVFCLTILLAIEFT